MLKLLVILKVLLILPLNHAFVNIFIDKEHLKNDLHLDFGNDLYIMSDGKPAPLLSNPDAFKNLVAPLHPSIERVRMRWYAYPDNGFIAAEAEGKLQYTVEVSSSDTDVVAEPEISIPKTGVKRLPILSSEFTVRFQCSGSKSGLVELGFRFAYTINANNMKNNVSIVVRRHCYQIEVWDSPSRNSSFLTSHAVRHEATLSNSTILGIILGTSALILLVLILFFLHYLQRRNKRLHMKFDVDYELKMKAKERGDDFNNCMHDASDEKQLLDHKIHHRPDKTIFISGERPRKRKRIRRKNFTCKSFSPFLSDPWLPDILEEDQQTGLISPDQDDGIVTVNLDLVGPGVSSTKTCSNVNISDQNTQQFGSDAFREAIGRLSDDWCAHFSDRVLFPFQISMIDERFTRTDTFSRQHSGKLKGLDKSHPSKVTPISIRIMRPCTDIRVVRAFMSEAEVMHRLRHENVMDLLGVVLCPTQLPRIVTPFMHHSDLSSLLRESRATPRHPQTLSSRQLINFAVQISCGMLYLSGKGFTHRALCAHNVMVNAAYTVKISGLQFMKEGKKPCDALINDHIGDFLRWMAVESVTEKIFSEKSDVWAFGVVLWELMTFGKQPYTGMTDSDITSFLSDCRRLQSPPNCPAVIIEMMYECWQQQPKNRPHFDQLFDQLSGYEDNYKKYVAEGVESTIKVVST